MPRSSKRLANAQLKDACACDNTNSKDIQIDWIFPVVETTIGLQSGILEPNTYKAVNRLHIFQIFSP
jgi:hypothetical protein